VSSESGALTLRPPGEDDAGEELAIERPVEEVAGLVRTGTLGGPGVDVGLRALGQVPTPLCQEGQEGDRRVEVGLGVGDRGQARRRSSGAPTSPVQQSPASVGGQQAAPIGVVDGLELGPDPALEAHQALVTGLQHAVGHQLVAEEVDGLARDGGIKHLVGHRPALCCQAGQDLGAGRRAQPVLRAVGLGSSHDGPMDRFQRSAGRSDELSGACR
jgi:hypothetical protein